MLNKHHCKKIHSIVPVLANAENSSLETTFDERLLVAEQMNLNGFPRQSAPKTVKVRETR